MVEGRRRDEWERTAHLRCQIANSFRIEGGRAFVPDDFDPFAGRRLEPPEPETIPFSTLKKILF